MVAANESGPTVDFPRRNERPEEQMAFGKKECAGANRRDETMSETDEPVLVSSAKILPTQATDRDAETVCVKLTS